MQMYQGNIVPTPDPNLDPDENHEWAQVIMAKNGSPFALAVSLFSLNDILNTQYNADYWVDLTALGLNASDAQSYWSFDPNSNTFSNPGADPVVADAALAFIQACVNLKAAGDAAQANGFEQGMNNARILAAAQGLDPNWVNFFITVMWPMYENQLGLILNS